MATLKCSIQAPGLGSSDSQAGSKLSNTYGVARPTPAAAKTSAIIPGGCEKANPSAPARNGAVHGVASAVASTPCTETTACTSAPARARSMTLWPPKQ